MTPNQVLGDMMTDDTYRDDDENKEKKEKKDEKNLIYDLSFGSEVGP